MAIDEASRRWPDFQGGRLIELPDGQTWCIYEPEAIVGGAGWRFGAAPDLDAALSVGFARILAKWGRATDDTERACATLEAAWFLLARNYNVTAEEFERILMPAVAWTQEKHDRMASEFAEVIGVAAVRLVAVMRRGVA